MRICYTLIIAAVLLGASSSYAQIYKCVENGRTVFTDQPCAGGEFVKLRNTNTSAQVEVTPFDERSARYRGETWHEGASGYRTAQRKAKEKKAPMIVYFRTDWCGFCRDVEANLFKDKAAIKAMRSFVKVRVNPEKGAAEDALFKKLKGSGYPTFFVQPADGRPRRVSVTRRPTADNPRRNIAASTFASRLKPYIPREAQEEAPMASAGAYHARAQQRFGDDQIDQALQDIKRAIALDPRIIEHYQLLADISRVTQKWGQSLRYWSRYIELSPGDPEGYFGRAVAHSGGGDSAAQASDIDAAIALGGELPAELALKPSPDATPVSTAKAAPSEPATGVAP